ncbi:putative cytoplasmic protein [Salmonella enterica subsp. enterica serovar Typhi]|nr:hypothetical protein [Salmonella enterica]CFX26467.1 putative cytoplasmic protein [Salmonella enterica subsp. enterica serovar Typhi]CFX34301.1 putative cytoplasmic protein [Salmonella enterica subsp. enterica serovar Typhi]CGH90906.1 putative cytoplasmic protein [Salmonella enterica subsp. enterica serovar Typhi]CGH97550.1 putative cytoplasmic protein [Salmonella enterica subsp. enterica serovar Typhi]CHM59003.1 putative cytoplasmic protein [Salmonella enterica subsp. enterica serovar Typh
MDTVEELNSTYFYAGRSNLTASQLLFMIFCENTANQLGVQDFGAHAWGLLSVLHHHGAHNVYYVKCTRTIKRHVKAAGFVHVKKLLAHKFDPFPAVTLREFC